MIDIVEPVVWTWTTRATPLRSGVASVAAAAAGRLSELHPWTWVVVERIAPPIRPGRSPGPYPRHELVLV